MYCVLSGVSAKQNNRNALRRLNTIPRIILHTLQSFMCVCFFFFLSCVRLNQDANKAPEGVLGDISLSVCVTPRFSLPEVLCWDWALCCGVSGSLALGDYSSLGHWTCRSGRRVIRFTLGLFGKAAPVSFWPLEAHEGRLALLTASDTTDEHVLLGFVFFYSTWKI